MKIFVNARFLTQPISGVQRYAIECSRKIKKIWPETRFLCPKNVWNNDVFQELGAEVVGSHTGHIWEQLDLRQFASANGKLPLLNPCNTAPLLYTNNITTIHDLAFHHHPEWNSRKFSTWYNFLIPRIARKSRHVFTVSETIASEIVRAYKIPHERISITYNGISEIMMPVSGSQPEKQPILLSVGTFNQRKNQAALVNGFLGSHAAKTHKLILVGDKNRIFSESGLDTGSLSGKNVEIRSGLSETELAMLYWQAEIVASTSLYEGFGIPLAEGLANGCKLICSEIPVYKELYGQVSTFCNPNNPTQIAAAIDNAVMSSPPDAEKVRPLLAKFSYEHAAKVIMETIESLR